MPALFVVGVLGVMISTLLNWSAVIRRVQLLEYTSKPLVVAFLLLVLLFAPGESRDNLQWWTGIALTLSLLGDVFLMLPYQGFFLPGLGAFLLAHIAYCIGFNALDAPGKAWLLWIPIALLAVLLLPKMLKRIRTTQNRHMRIPVMMYGLILSAMLFSSWSTLFLETWTTRASILAAIGGSLFFTSDVLLGWDRFVAGRHAYQVVVIITYHIAQICLVSAVIIQSLG